MSDSFVSPWTLAHRAPLSVGFPRQEYWSGLPCPPPGDLPNTGMKLMSPVLAGRSFTIEPPGKIKMLTQSCLVFATLWTVARQASLSIGVSRQEHWSGLPCPPPGDLPHPGVKSALPTLAGGFFTTEPPGKPIEDVSCQQLEPREHVDSPNTGNVLLVSWFIICTLRSSCQGLCFGF